MLNIFESSSIIPLPVILIQTHELKKVCYKILNY